MKQLNTLSKIEYAEGAELALTNSKDHLKVANLAIKNDCHGIGVSHLVLAAEELAKAIALKLSAIDNKVIIENLKDYFFKHKTKHHSFIEFIGSILIEKIKELDAKKVIKDIKWTDAIIYFILIMVVKNYFGNKDMTLKDFNDFRNAGFYVSIRDNQWESPNQQFGLLNCLVIKILIEEALNLLEDKFFTKELSPEELTMFIDNLPTPKIMMKQ